MTKSGQKNGSTRTKSPEFNGAWNLNHVEWLVEKFGRHVGEIKARDVRNKCSIKLLDIEYRKLLELAVINGRAYSNGRPVSHNKYAIYFSSGNSFLDDELLLNPGIIDLPSRSYWVEWHSDVNITSVYEWDVTKIRWMCIYLLFCGFQKEGKVNLDILPNYLDSHTKKSLGLEVRMYTYIYKALKFSWDEMPKAYKYKYNCNVIFLDILQACSSNDLSRKLSGFKLHSPRSVE